jgi:peptidoglycan/xylan/chitin deacetylase (PgdA/CDA1 family)
MRTVSVFFDLEDQSHKPSVAESNTEKDVGRILNILDKCGAKAVFNTCGIIVENYPSMIRGLYRGGHEISSHGYRHENFVQLSPDELDRVLSITEGLIQDATGERPIGIRSPWLLTGRQVYEVIERRGYKWVSNRYSEFPEIRNRPDRVSVPRRPTPTSVIRGLRRNRELKKRWESYQKEPYQIGQMFEIPMLSSMDGDLLFYLSPTQESPDKWLDYAYDSLVSQFNRSENYFNLNFHPWVIASANRISLLDRIMSFVSKQDVKFILPKNQIANGTPKPT